jgi:hypothetical protein
MMSEDDRRARAQEIRRRSREKYNVPPNWPLRIDPVGHEFYDPLDGGGDALGHLPLAAAHLHPSIS